MERLTIDEIIEHCDRKTEMYEKACDVKYLETTTMNNPIKEYWEHKQVAECLRKLKAYEDLEEHGRLIILPCKVGDIVYVNDILGCGEVERYKVIRVDYHSTLGTGRNEFYIEALLCTNPDKSIAFYDKQFGKTVFGKTIFLTKSEAEARLKELRGSNE